MFRRFLKFWLAPFRLLLRLPAALITAPQRLMGMSLPTRWAMIVAIGQIIVLVTALIKFYNTEDHAGWRVYLGDYLAWILFTLVVMAGLVVLTYYLVALWLKEDASPFDDIDHAWKEGMAALGKHGIDLARTPLFMVLGARDADQVNSIFAASRLGYRVQQVPVGNNALHWYASPEAIFLVCTDACRLSRLANKDHETQLTRSPSQYSQDWTGTVLVDSLENTAEGTALPPMPGRERAPLPVRGMQMPGEAPAGGEDTMDAVGNKTMMIGDISAGGEKGASSPGRLSEAESRKQTAKLDYVCSLLKTGRHNLCPLNGILALIPFDALQNESDDGSETAIALKEDLATIRNSTRLRCTVTVLVVGMESEDGFCELVQRVGSKRSTEQRFGRGVGDGVDIWKLPSPALIQAVTDNACGNFEAWIYELFKQKDGLDRPTNGDLYALLIKTRQLVRVRLRKILEQACGATSSDEEPLLFSGLYFSATGSVPEEQAFVQSVFRKVTQLDRELAWTRQACRDDSRKRQWSYALFTISGLLLIATIVTLFWRES